MMAQITIDQEVVEQIQLLKTEIEQAEKDEVSAAKAIDSAQKKLEQATKDLFEKRTELDDLVDGLDEPLRSLLSSQSIREAKEIAGTTNKKVSAAIKKMLKDSDDEFISLSKKVKEDLASTCQATMADVEATIESILTSYNPEGKKGRNIRFQLK